MKMTETYDVKLICCSPRYFVCSHKGNVYVLDRQEHDIGRNVFSKIPSVDGIEKISKNALLCRAMRLDARCGIFIDDDSCVISLRGHIYRIDCRKNAGIREHSFRDGMNNPISFAKIENITGFENGIYYGEYFGNSNREPVRLFVRTSDGEWKNWYTFPQNTINHVHRIFAHPYRDSVIVFTGDTDEESAIWEFKGGSGNVRKVLQGSQQYRACVGFPVGNGIAYATDTPLEPNGLYLYDFTDEIHRKLADTDGPAIYGVQADPDTFVFSTSVEPDSRISRIRYRFTYKLGPGVKNRESHIYVLKNTTDGVTCKEVFSAKKDILPMLAFQFGTFLFPPVCGRDVFAVGQSIRHYEHRTINISDMLGDLKNER